MLPCLFAALFMSFVMLVTLWGILVGDLLTMLARPVRTVGAGS